MFAFCKSAQVPAIKLRARIHSDAERAIQGTWCSAELMKALEKGYSIVQMHHSSVAFSAKDRYLVQ